MTIEAIVKKMGYSSRTVYYRHIKNPNLKAAIIDRYSKVIRYDFSFDLQEPGLSKAAESAEVYLPVPETFEEAISQRDFYWKKYNEQLEEYRKLKTQYSMLLQQTPN